MTRVLPSEDAFLFTVDIFRNDGGVVVTALTNIFSSSESLDDPMDE